LEVGQGVFFEEGLEQDTGYFMGLHSLESSSPIVDYKRWAQADPGFLAVS